MANFVSTIVAALIGSIVGSVGAVMTDHWLNRRSEIFHRRELLVQRYLFQLQDALEALYYRLDNLAKQGGRYVMSDEYFEISTLYALGRVLAIERIFALEAVYPQLEAIYPRSGLGEFLKTQRIDLQLEQTDFYQYDRLSLAEAVIEHEGDLFRTSTYLEFRRRYETEHAPEKQWLAPASKAIQSLPKARMEALLAMLKTTAKRIAEKTGIDSSLVRAGDPQSSVGIWGREE